tara:strand:- start:54 stop:1721 length:1668 start_codon:yes stop_codon:yes gene_type:complete
MFEIFCYSFIFVILFTPFGFFLTGDTKINLYLFSKELIFGSILLSFIAILINFFFPLNLFVNTIILLVSIIVLIKKRKRYINLKFLKFVILISILLTFLITESNVYRPDAGLYHLPFIGILNSEKIILGLSNLHFRYGHTSIVQHLSAIYNNLIFKDNGIVFAQAIIASSVIINFSYQVHKYITTKKYSFHLYVLFFILVFIFYKMNRYSEYGNDAPSHFLFFFFVSEVILYLNNKHSSLENNIILSLFVIQNKILLLPVIIFNFIGLKFNNIKKLFLRKNFYFLFFFIFIWITKNILTTGCIIYPIKESCIKNLSWTSIENINHITKESEVWAKGYFDLEPKIKAKTDYEKFLNNFYWVNAWSKKHLKLINEIMLPYLILCLLIILIFYFKSKNNYQKKNRIEYYLISVSFLTVLIWFLKAPLFRYGYSTIITFLSLVFASILSNRDINYKKINFTVKTIIFLGFFIIISKNLVRIINTQNSYANYPWPKYFSMKVGNNKNTYIKKELIYKQILVPEKPGYCMYVKNICNHYGLNENLNIKNLKSYDIIYFDSR